MSHDSLREFTNEVTKLWSNKARNHWINDLQNQGARKWIDHKESLNQWVKEATKQWINELTNKKSAVRQQRNQSMNRWMNELVSWWIYDFEPNNQSLHESMSWWNSESKYGWSNECKNERNLHSTRPQDPRNHNTLKNNVPRTG